VALEVLDAALGGRRTRTGGLRAVRHAISNRKNIMLSPSGHAIPADSGVA
jgi:hypothetical protein